MMDDSRLHANDLAKSTHFIILNESKLHANTSASAALSNSSDSLQPNFILNYVEWW